MDDSVLNGTKKALGLDPSYDVFDPDIVMHINSTFATLNQIGVGPEIPFSITDDSQRWADFIMADGLVLQMVKSYMYLKVRILFDPPASSSILESFKKSAEEYEWRLNFHAEGVRTNGIA